MEPIKLPKRTLKKLIKLFKKTPLDVIISPQWGVYVYIMEEPITTQYIHGIPVLSSRGRGCMGGTSCTLAWQTALYLHTCDFGYVEIKINVSRLNVAPIMLPVHLAIAVVVA